MLQIFKGPRSLKIIEENVSTESLFHFTEISVSEITNGLSSVNTKKVETLGDIPTKVLKISSDICNKVIQKIWNSEILGKQYFPQNLKLADVTSAFKKKDPTLAKNCRPASLLLTISKVFERIIRKQLSTHIKLFLSPYLCGYSKRFSTQIALISLIEK